MPAPSFSDLERLLDERIGNVDASDPKGKKRLKILQAATALFLRQGYRKTSVDEVAREAGVAKGTVYLYFETKVDLVVAAIALEKRAFLSGMRPLFAPELDPRERLRRYLLTVLVVAQQMPLVSRMMSGDQEWLVLMSELPPELLSQNKALGVEFMLGMVEAAVGTERWNRIEREDRAKVLLGLSSFASLIGNEQLRGGLSIDRFATILVDLVVDGLVRFGRGPSLEGAQS